MKNQTLILAAGAALALFVVMRRQPIHVATAGPASRTTNQNFDLWLAQGLTGVVAGLLGRPAQAQTPGGPVSVADTIARAYADSSRGADIWNPNEVLDAKDGWAQRAPAVAAQGGAVYDFFNNPFAMSEF